MTKFRPCIDIHDGQVKQIVGSSLNDDGTLIENFVAEKPPEWFAAKYQQDDLHGGHVIKLGGGNDEAALAALASYSGGLQIGGGINLENAATWLDAGASHVILTSWLFQSDGKFQSERLDALVKSIGKNKIVIDLSCKRVAGNSGWQVAMNRWQKLTELAVDEDTLDQLAGRCEEFLIHAADVEGKCQGIDEELVELMGRWGKIPMTYAGGVADMSDVERVSDASGNKVDVTVGSALDLFGGTGVKYQELLAWNLRTT